MKFLLYILPLLLPAALSAQNCTLSLSGHVEDADTRELLAGAVVTIAENGKTVVTDSKGDFTFAGLCSGNYTLTISHAHCETAERKLQLAKNQHIDIFMPHARRTLGEVVVETQKGIANTGFKKELTARALEETKGLSLAAALSRINGVTMLQTGSTITKPVIHGLHSSRILTINNGVRQEGQQWGNEHAPEIDPFIADKLVVIKGVDELRYGSDAIAGVILVEPRALRSTPGWSAEFNTAYFTNNRQYVVSGVWEQQLKKTPAFRYRIQGTYKRGANAATPGYRLNNTASEEKNFSITAGWKKERFSTELYYSSFATQLGIFSGSHIGNLTDLLDAIAAARPNPVFTGQNSYKIGRPRQDVSHQLIKSKTVFFSRGHKFSLQLGAQLNNRKEFDVVRSSTNTRPQLNLSINTFTQDISWDRPVKNNFSGAAGISLMQQDNSYTGRYFIPNYFAYSFGGYITEKWSRHKWELQGGIRFDNKSINTTRLKFNGDTLNYDFNFSTLAASFNTIYKPTEHWRLNISASLASRAPYVNELLSDGIHHGTATYEKGDIRLKTEKSLNFSGGISWQNSSRSAGFEVLAYANLIRDFIYQQPQPGAPVLTIAGAFPLITYRQTNALLTGFDISATIKPATGLEWQPRASFLYARNTLLNDWLILMPANRFSNMFTYNFKDGSHVKDSYVSLEWQQVLRQGNVPDETNGKQDYKAPPPGYGLLHFTAAASVKLAGTAVSISAGVQNVLNTRYRDYLNSMRYFADETGRNISLRLKVPLSHVHH